MQLLYALKGDPAKLNPLNSFATFNLNLEAEEVCCDASYWQY